ncbi:MAG: site-specific DNA-methyltransferase [Promethearchaeota archaeon]
MKNPEVDPTHTFNYPNSRSKSDPELIWQGRAKKNLQIPKATFSPLLTIDPPYLLQNLSKHPDTKKLLSDKNFVAVNYALLSPKLEMAKAPWINRVIHGDSLIAMAALVHQGYAGQVQMIYMDPPFGINFQGKFQSGAQKVEGYLDNWELGLSSYLSYLRDRLVVMQQLVTPEGSIFVQIGEQNLHYVRCLLDEIFGRENFVSQITFRTAISTNKIQGIADYLLWYAKDKLHLFRRKLFTKRPLDKIKKTFTYSYTDPKSGKEQAYKPQELVKRRNLTKPSRFDRMYTISLNGKDFSPPSGFEWRWDKTALERLKSQHRISEINGKLYGMRFEADFPAMILTNVWNDTSTSTFAAKKHYTVHTNPKVIRRCMAMTTRPGDLVLDPTSGSGTTAVVAETLGRRWVVCDTSPASIMSTTNWLFGTLYPTYRWDATEGDFAYSTLKKVSLSDIAHHRTSTGQFRYDLPRIHKRNIRLTTPFQIELLTAHHQLKEDWPQKFLSMLNKNGLLLPSGESLQYSDFLLPSYASEDLKATGYFSTQGKLGDKSVQFLVSPPSGQLNEDHILKKLINPKSDFHANRLVLCASQFSCGFIAALIHAELFPSKVDLAIIHPDLLIDGLNVSNHASSIRSCGYLNVSSTSKTIQPQFLDPTSGSVTNISSDQIIIWGWIYENSSFLAQFFQIPFYTPFLAKDLSGIVNNSLDKSISPNNSFCFGINSNGIPFFGIR